MLLRRITQHVKDQNWFAVFLDFFIVVVGVFVGMQVQQQYAERARRVADGQYMERLHTEITDLVSIRENVIQPRHRNFDDLVTATDKIFSDAADVSLRTQECAAIQLSHIFTNPTIDLPTVDELLSAGRLDSLSSQPIRNAIVRYTQSAARANDVIESINAGVLTLSRKYPNLIMLDAANTQDFGLILKSPLPECDLEGMRANQGFKNDLADNKSRFETYYLFTLVEPTNQLRDIHDVLDAELSIEHSVQEGSDS